MKLSYAVSGSGEVAYIDGSFDRESALGFIYSIDYDANPDFEGADFMLELDNKLLVFDPDFEDFIEM